MIDKHIQISTLMDSIIIKIDKLLDKEDGRIISARLNKKKRSEILELLKQEKYKDGLSVPEITSLVGMNRKDVDGFMSFLFKKGDVTRFKGMNNNPKGGKHKAVFYYSLK